MSASQGSSPPICIGDTLYWFTDEGLLKIDIKTLSADIIKTNSPIQSNVVMLDRNIYTGDKNGNVIEFNTEDRSLNSLKVSDNSLRKPIAMNKRLLISSKDMLYEIGV